MLTRREFIEQAAAISATTSMLGSGKGVAAQSLAIGSDAEARRRAYLETFLKIFPPSSPPLSGRMNAHDQVWEDWLKRTNELPPDFASMSSIPELPDPLIFEENGRRTVVTNATEWNRQRQWTRSQVEHWFFGTMPPAPGNVRGVVTDTKREGTTTVRDVQLEFGPDHRATLRLQLIIPDGEGPFPVFLTNHPRTLPWLYIAVRRGYLGCFYAAHDPLFGGGTDDSDRFIEIYPEYDFTCLARWAWSASRAIDYLITLTEVDKDKIGLAGHSRYGKQALLAAAFDERIGAVVPSSGNTGECDPWRYTTDMFVNESIELITGLDPHWFHPRLRFFAGQEDKLPIDQNSLMSLVAPRGLMMYAGYAESAGNPFGFEQAYRSVRSVYTLLGHEENLWLHLRDGEHPTSVVNVEQFIDFFDTVFRLEHHPKSQALILGYRFEDWQKISKEKINPLTYPKRSVGDFLNGADGLPISSVEQWAEKKKSILQRISRLLGGAPPQVPYEPQHHLWRNDYGNEGWLATLYNRPINDDNQQRYSVKGMGVIGLPFGAGLLGELFYPLDADGRPKPGKWPVVVWLHHFSYQNGWSAGFPWHRPGSLYRQDQRPEFLNLAERGFAVLAFDQPCFGARIHEATHFYNRYPKWSIMGNMIQDTRGAVDALSNLEEIDSSRIFLMGYALGGKIGLLTAAYEDRIKGLVSICGFDPLRLDTRDKGTEGIRQYSHLHGLIPRLGFFVDHEERVPFDFDEVLASVAPKPTLVVAPTLDRYARVADVEREVEASKKIYALLGHSEALQIVTPVDINCFNGRIQQTAFDWLSQVSAET